MTARSEIVRNPLFALGASLYPLQHESDGPEGWYGFDASADFDALADAGCGLARIYASWRELEPQVGQVSEPALAKLVALVTDAHNRGLKSLVCLFAEDPIAELSEVAWAQRRDPRTDPYLLEREVALVETLADRLRPQRSVFGWQLGNAKFIEGFGSAEELEAWMSRMYASIREHDRKRLIGFGADPEAVFRAKGLDCTRAAQSCDFVAAGATPDYRGYIAGTGVGEDNMSYVDAFLLRLARRGKPVLLDNIGPFARTESVLEEAESVRLGLWSAFCNRSAGAMLAQWRDVEVEGRSSYGNGSAEVAVGVTDNTGEPKPAVGSIRQFAGTIAGIDLKSHALVSERAAILVPDECYATDTSAATLLGPRACLRSFIGAKQAHLPVTVIREGDDFAGMRLICIPSVSTLCADTWERLQAFLDGGGSVVMSYGGVEPPAAFRAIFGVDFLGEGGPRSKMSCRVAQPDMLTGLESFSEPFDTSAYALVSAVQATVLATDENGSPLVTVTNFGRGRAMFIAVPLERALAQNEWHAQAPGSSLLLSECYSSAGVMAGCAGPVTCDARQVELALFQGGDDDVLVLMNHSNRKVTTSVWSGRRVESVADVGSASATAVAGNTFAVRLERFGVNAIRLNYKA